jgi:multiple sugar transport system permease protein
MKIRSKINLALIYSFLLLLFFITAIPLWWTFITSFKGFQEVFTRPYQLFPETFTLNNFVQIFQMLPFGIYLFNSLYISALVCLGTIVTSSMAGYAFAKLRFWGREIIFIFFLATLMIPKQVVLVPNFILFRTLGLIDNHLTLILTGIFTAFGTFLMRQFFFGLPKELDEAAIIDGYSYFAIFLKIILPLSKPALVTLFILSLLWSWNEFLFALIFINDPMKRTLTLGLALLRGDLDIQWNLITAATVITVSPIVIAYVAAQRFFIEGIALTGLKG